MTGEFGIVVAESVSLLIVDAESVRSGQCSHNTSSNQFCHTHVAKPCPILPAPTGLGIFANDVCVDGTSPTTERYAYGLFCMGHRYTHLILKLDQHRPQTVFRLAKPKFAVPKGMPRKLTNGQAV